MTALFTLAQGGLPGKPVDWLIYGSIFIVFVVLMFFVLMVTTRKFIRRGEPSDPQDEFAPPRPKSEDGSAFLTASMQSVIARLKEQEKELERLHRLEKERAQQSTQLSAAVTRNMPTGLLLVNEAGLITMSNPAAETALGTSGLAFRRFSEVLGSDSALVALLSACLREGRTFQREEVDHFTSSGDVRHLGVTISPVLPPGDPKPKITGALCLLSDLTELTELQQQVRLKENLAALGEMAAGIAHEFKNSLATISGHAQLIRGEAAVGSEAAESSEKILTQIRSLTYIITEFLRFSRPLEVSAEPVDARRLVDAVIEECAPLFPSVTFSLQGEFPPVEGDEPLLRQALLNLVRNAAEAVAPAPAGPPPERDATVVVSAEAAEHAGHPGLRLTVADNGPGIAENDFSKLFIPFFTTKPSGSGVGLALVHKILVHHGGTVQARNRPEGGAEFIVWLPAPVEPPEAVDSASPRI